MKTKACVFWLVVLLLIIVLAPPAMGQIPDFETIKYFDYNGNGRIDFADVTMLFQEQ